MFLKRFPDASVAVLLVLHGFFLLSLSSIARSQTIDPFLTPFPPNPDLTNTHRPWIFTGLCCDKIGGCAAGDPWASHSWWDSIEQTGLPEVLGGTRTATLTAPSAVNSFAVIDPSVLSVGGGGGAILVQYGRATDLNANLLSFAATRFVTIFDNWRPDPVTTTITVTSGRGTQQERTASQTIVMSASAPPPASFRYEFPFSGFDGVDFSDIDQITFRSEGCCNWGFRPLATDGVPVVADGFSWGRLKANYLR